MLQWVQCLKSPKCVFTSSSTHPRSMISPYSIIFHSAKLSFSHNFLWLYFRFTFPGPWKKSPAWQAQATAFHKEPGYCVCDILTSLFYICNRIYHIHYVLHMFIQWSYILCIICSIYIYIHIYVDNVNPGLINPKRLLNWEVPFKYQIITFGGIPP
jgi:hypothetical protein